MKQILTLFILLAFALMWVISPAIASTDRASPALALHCSVDLAPTQLSSEDMNADRFFASLFNPGRTNVLLANIDSSLEIVVAGLMNPGDSVVLLASKVTPTVINTAAKADTPANMEVDSLPTVLSLTSGRTIEGASTA